MYRYVYIIIFTLLVMSTNTVDAKQQSCGRMKSSLGIYAAFFVDDRLSYDDAININSLFERIYENCEIKDSKRSRIYRDYLDHQNKLLSENGIKLLFGMGYGLEYIINGESKTKIESMESIYNTSRNFEDAKEIRRHYLNNTIKVLGSSDFFKFMQELLDFKQ